jgi:8-oxo-dGTP pyrophosphatase MutT (NUDIX family)
MQRHFTATAYVFDPAGRILLLWHGKLLRWMPPGGHVDENELPEDAAVRECKEETGLDIEIVEGDNPDLYGANRAEGRMMKRPAAMFLEEIPVYVGSATKPPQPAHQHMDCIYRARPIDPSQEIRMEHPDAVVKWFTPDEVRAIPKGEIYENIRTFILAS